MGHPPQDSRVMRSGHILNQSNETRRFEILSARVTVSISLTSTTEFKRAAGLLSVCVCVGGGGGAGLA